MKNEAKTEIEPLREVMDIRQAAAYLGISSDTLYKYASESFVPAFKLGNRWRFRRSRLEEWMDRQSGLTQSGLTQTELAQTLSAQAKKVEARSAPVTIGPKSQARLEPKKKPVRSAGRNEPRLRGTR